MERYTCHIEIFVDRMDIKDVDGDGQEEGRKGDIKLTERAWAKGILTEREANGQDLPFRILSESESAELDAAANG